MPLVRYNIGDLGELRYQEWAGTRNGRVGKLGEATRLGLVDRVCGWTRVPAVDVVGSDRRYRSA
jgi:hypothetical protein